MMKVWQGLFALAALYNLAVGGAMLAAQPRIAEQLGVSGPGAGFIIAMSAILIAAFGVGYAFVAHAPARNRAIVWIGMAGKFAVVLLSASRAMNDASYANVQSLALPGGDLLFVLAFALFLWRGPR